MDDVSVAERAFVAREDGTYEPRHFFAADMVAAVVSLVGIIVLVLVLLVILGGVAAVTADDSVGAPAAAPVEGPR